MTRPGLHHLVEDHAAARPQAPAVVAGEVVIGYRELEARANRLAWALAAQGVGRGAVVGLVVERSVGLVVGTLGILKAGAAVLPLDPDYPPEHLRVVLGDAGAVVVLTQPELASRLPAGLAVGAWDRPGSHPATPPPVEVGPEDLAYVISTSGSTGAPKGVELTHGGLGHAARTVAALVGLGPGDRVVQFCSVSFDVSIEEIFATFAAGATLVLRPPEVAVLGGGWRRWLDEARISVLDLPTAYWHAWVRDLVEAGAEVPAGIRAVIVGGERASGRAYRDWLGVGGRRVRWYNAYGPAEASVMATVWAPPPGTELAPGADPPIGRPLPGVGVAVLDPAGRPVPVGVVGELHLGGVGLARGYRGRPELTAERFGADPDGAGPGARRYRTGDLVRWLASGDLEFVGRVDDQVKVRGFRIEVAEVEAALAAHPAVAEAVVVARDVGPVASPEAGWSGGPGGEAGSGDRRLVAYVVARGQELERGELRRFVAARLPGFMVPSAVVVVDSLPLTPTGKVDRQALPPPAPARSASGVAPAATPTEEALVAIWSRVLGVEGIGVDDDFFDLGGHSLLATQVIARVREAFGRDVPLRAIFEAPTVAGLAAVLDAAARRGEAPPLVAEDRPPGTRGPLSLAQEQMWALEVEAVPQGLYNVTALHRFDGPADGQALQRTLAWLADRHEILRTSFGTDEGRPYQVVAASTPVDLAVTDLTRLPPETQDPELRRRVGDQDARPFDLASAPLFRARLFRLADHDVLAVTFDHLIADGTSAYVFLRELATAYAAFSSGHVPDLPPLELQYGDFALWQRAEIGGDRLDAQLEYWRRKLDGMPLGPAVPFDRVPEALAGPIEVRTIKVASDAYQAAEQVARAAGATVFVVCVAAAEAVLARVGGQQDVVMSTTLNGRQRAELEALVGVFSGISRIRTDLGGDPSFADIVRRARDTVLEMFEHQDIPFMQVRRTLLPDFPRDPVERASVLPVELGYFRVPRHEPAPGRVAADRPADELFLRGQLHPLSITFLDDGTQLWGELTYKADFYDDATIEQLAHGLERVLAVATRDPSLRLSELPLG